MTSIVDHILLSTFVEAAKRGSFSQTALATRRTQAAVTLQIQRLEHILGQPLFNRSTRGVSLTTAGLEFLPYAERLLRLGAEAQDFMTRHKKPIYQRSKRITIIEDLASIVALEHGLSSLRERFGELNIDVNFDSGHRAEKAFNAGEIDMLIGDRMYAPTVHGTPVSATSVPLAWIASPEFDLSQRPLPLAVYGSPCIWRDHIITALDTAGIASKVAVESRHIHALLSTVKSGIALTALLPSSVEDGLVVVDPLAAGLPPAPNIEIVLYHAQQALHDPAINALSTILWQGVEVLRQA